ncbi:MAG: EI24 domain-containing protein [Novosphingobium sp.]
MTGNPHRAIRRAMIAAFALAFGQLGDRRIVVVLGKTVALTLAIFAALGLAGWFGLGWALDRVALPGEAGLRALLAAALAALAGWLLFRLVALAVLQLFADEVVAAVEARHYPAAAAAARPLGWRGELRVGARGVVRALGYNLAAVALAVPLLATAVGPALLFGAVNAILLGRELGEMAALRHRDARGAAPMPGFAARLGLGAVVVALLAVPFVNLLAPVLGAAAATHLVHRRARTPAHA